MEFSVAPLRELQEVDRKVAQHLLQEEELPKAIQAVDDELRARQQEMDNEKLKLTELQKRKKDAETEIEATKGKIAHYKDQLLNVKTNKEYSALLKEIDTGQKKIDSVEETIIGVLIEVDEHNAHIKKIELWLQSEKTKLMERRGALEQELARTKQQREECERARGELEKHLPESLLRIYTRVRELRGTALAEAKNQFCMECNVRLRPQVFNDIRQNKMIITCESCDRILFYDGPPPEPAEETAAPPPEGDQEPVSEPAGE